MPGIDIDEPRPNGAGGEAAGSNVIMFPGRIRPGAKASAREAEDAAARLDRALLTLTQALAEQQEAIRAWRHGLRSLAESMGSPADGLCALDAELAAASARLKIGADENGRKVIRSSGFNKEGTPAPEQPFDPSSD